MKKADWKLSTEGLLEGEKRAFLIYEYARSSPAMVSKVVAARANSIWSSDVELSMLVELRDFPRKGFLEINEKKRRQLVPPNFGEKAPGVWLYPHAHFFVPDVPTELVDFGYGDDLEWFKLNKSPGPQKYYVLDINWKKLTDQEIISALEKWVKAARPARHPQRAVLGRNPLGERFRNVSDKLNQLVAYRLDQAGISRERASTMGFRIYNSPLAWKKAIAGARERIELLFGRG